MARRNKNVATTSTERSRLSRGVSKILTNRNRIVNRIMQTTNPNFVNDPDSTNNSSIITRDENTLENQLVDWINEHRISKRAVNDLLSVLNAVGGQSLPKDYRTLLKTDTNIEIVSNAGGDYWYNGMKKCLTQIFSNLDRNLTIRLNFNIDGLPLYKSSKHTFYPILCSIHGKDCFF